MTRKLTKIELAALLKKRISLSSLPSQTVHPAAQANLSFLDELYPLQLEILNSPSRQKALLCGRRFGKTYVMRAALLQAALTDKCDCLFLAPTRIRAESLLWKLLDDANKDYSLGADMNQVKLEMTFPNGSVIKLAGCDTESDADKNLRGSGFKLICIDEAGHIGDHLDQVIKRIIDWTLIERPDSALWLSGTPNHHCTGYFHDVTRDLTNPPHGWAVWHGTILDNPTLEICLDEHGNTKPNWKELVQHELDELKKKEGWDDQSPEYRREGLAEWYRDDSSVVVSFSDERNLFTHLPETVTEWTFVTGVDFGLVDPFAIVTLCWSPQTPTCYVVDSFAQPGLHGHQQADLINKFAEKYGGYAVYDYASSGKQHVFDYSHQYKIPLLAAKKGQKIEHIERLSDDFRQGKVKVQKDLAPLIEQLKKCVWKDKVKSDMTKPRDLLDALHYAWRESGHHSYDPQDPTRKPAELSEDVWESCLKLWAEEAEFRL